MTQRTYELYGAGFSLVGTIDEKRLPRLVKMFDKIAAELSREPTVIGVQRYDLEVSDHEAYGAMVRTTERGE